MTMTLVWTGVALWLALNAAVAVCLLVAQPGSGDEQALSRVPPDVNHARRGRAGDRRGASA